MSKTRVFMLVSEDELELPLCVEDSVELLARRVGTSKNCISSMGASHKHGKWIRRWKTVDGNVFRCSDCGVELAVEEEEMFFDFCPYCGADMRKEPGDGQTG